MELASFSLLLNRAFSLGIRSHLSVPKNDSRKIRSCPSAECRAAATTGSKRERRDAIGDACRRGGETVFFRHRRLSPEKKSSPRRRSAPRGGEITRQRAHRRPSPKRKVVMTWNRRGGKREGGRGAAALLVCVFHYERTFFCFSQPRPPRRKKCNPHSPSLLHSFTFSLLFSKHTACKKVKNPKETQLLFGPLNLDLSQRRKGNI